MRNKSQAALVAVLIISTVACLHKSGGTKVTPWEKVHTYNAVFAETNNTVERGAEAAASSGLLNPSQAGVVIAWTGQVASVHQQITSILEKGMVTDADLSTVRVLLTQIKDSGTALVNSGALGIKNPKTQQTFAADIDAIYSAGDAILSALQQIKAGGN